MNALEKKNTKKAFQLIHAGANTGLVTPEGNQSWSMALGLRDINLIKLMLKKRPQLVSQGKPLLAASTLGSTKVVQKLLEAGADMNETSGYGETPLMAASNCPDGALKIINRTANDFELVVDELIKAGADLDRKRDDGMTALMLAISSRHEAIAGSLIDAGAEVNTVDNCGNTALILAAREGLNDIAEKLIRAGANRKVINAYGKTAIDYAREKGSWELITLELNQFF